MIEKIKLRNFQSIRDAEFKLGNITVLTAPTDTGKSAVIRALYAFFTNNFNSEFAHNGNFPIEVTLEKEGRKAIGRRTSKGVEYQLDKTEFTKTGKKFPEDIADFLGIKEYPVDIDLSVFLNIQTQFEPPFLLTKQDNSLLSKIIGKISNLNIVLAAIRKMSAESISKKQDITYLSSQKLNAEKKLLNLEVLTSLKEKQKAILSVREDIRNLVVKQEKVERTLKDARAYQDKKELIKEICLVNEKRALLESLIEKQSLLTSFNNTISSSALFKTKVNSLKKSKDGAYEKDMLLTEIISKTLSLQKLKSIQENPFSKRESKQSLIALMQDTRSDISTLISLKQVQLTGSSYLEKVSSFKNSSFEYNNKLHIYEQAKSEFLKEEIICPYSNDIMQDYCKKILLSK